MLLLVSSVTGTSVAPSDVRAAVAAFHRVRLSVPAGGIWLATTPILAPCSVEGGATRTWSSSYTASVVLPALGVVPGWAAVWSLELLPRLCQPAKRGRVRTG